MDTPAHSHAPLLSGRRTCARARLELPGVFQMVGSRRKCQIANLSASGARLRIFPTLAPGTEGILQFAGHEVFGTVVWAQEKSCGVTFDERIDTKIVIELRRLADQRLAYPDLIVRSAVCEWVNGKGRIVLDDDCAT